MIRIGSRQDKRLAALNTLIRPNYSCGTIAGQRGFSTYISLPLRVSFVLPHADVTGKSRIRSKAYSKPPVHWRQAASNNA